MNIIENEYITKQELCQMCNISESTAYKLLKSKKIRFEKCCDGLLHYYKIPMVDVINYMQERADKGYLTVNMSIRMDTELKKQADAMLADMGLNMTTAMNMFLRQVVRQGKIPFEIATDIPNAETLAAMKKVDDMISGKIPAKKYTSTDELFKDLES
ncbi:MAG: type II toxin-antitoxin system RelB/DinJ family antitoxin [Hominilimicola sp.]